MGSRLTLSLASLTNNPDIRVVLTATTYSDEGGSIVVQSATVEYSGFSHTFDAIARNGTIILETDFNWFRYGDEHWSRRLMKMLYETGTPFRVFPG
jgi:hypothetical protein